MSDTAALNFEAVTHRLEEALQVEFTFYRTEALANRLIALSRADQEFIINWITRVSSTHLEISHQFALRAVELVQQTDKHLIEAWLIHAMDTYDVDGMFPAMKIVQNPDQFLHNTHLHHAGVVLNEKRGVLLHFLHGLSGRQLKIDESDETYTDSETVFLPAVLAALPRVEDNFKLLKAMAALQWAQTRYGTLNLPLQDIEQSCEQPQSFLDFFVTLETERLESCIQRELPGLYREMQSINALLNQPGSTDEWDRVCEPLRSPAATAQDSLNLTRELFGRISPPAPRGYRAALRPDEVARIRAARIEREKARLKVALNDLFQESSLRDGSREQPPAFRVREPAGERAPLELNWELTLDDTPIAPPDSVVKLMNSVMLDFSHVPPEHLVPSPAGDFDPALLRDKEANADDVWSGTYHEEGAFLYPEWDYRRQYYRKNWCAVREKDLTLQEGDFYKNTLQKYSKQIRQLRKTFEALRDENRQLRRQFDGEDIDIDALIEALADRQAGQEMSERLFVRMHRADRNIAVCFMVDMSGSTQGWINLAERESLILLCEALEHLGDRYAIYGFSGFARKRCEIYKIKTFAEPYNQTIAGRIGAIQPQDYTRMGFAIRHLTQKLRETDAKTRILITLSDGRPYDLDYYCDDYGIEDTRRALIDARLNGIHPYCITIDKTAHEYLPHMYGAARYTVLEDVASLPYKVTDIYKKLTI